jgi:hypothetical protein
MVAAWQPDLSHRSRSVGCRPVGGPVGRARQCGAGLSLAELPFHRAAACGSLPANQQSDAERDDATTCAAAAAAAASSAMTAEVRRGRSGPCRIKNEKIVTECALCRCFSGSGLLADIPNHALFRLARLHVWLPLAQQVRVLDPHSALAALAESRPSILLLAQPTRWQELDSDGDSGGEDRDD